MIEKKILNISRIENTDKYDRKKVGYFSGLIGTCLNIILGISKFFIGILVNSVSVTADAVNNFSDAIYSFATVLGFKFSSAPPDKNHPYGHGRIEYITTLIISMMIMLVGFQFTKTSIEKIISPEKIVMNKIGITFLVISIFVKLWMSLFNKKLGKIIDSSILKATSTDCLSDVCTTSVVLVAMIFSKYTTFPIDGLVGLIVSIFILISGFSLAKETISELIGETPDNEFIKKILNDIEKFDDVLGVHHLTFHKYGHLQIVASAHVEVSSDMELVKAHNIATIIEKEIRDKYDVSIVIHIDPVASDCSQRELELKDFVLKWASQIEYIKSIHDFAIYHKDDSEFLGVEIFIDGNKLKKDFYKEQLISEFDRFIKSFDPRLKTSVLIIVDYM